jgi:hypothetical protein
MDDLLLEDNPVQEGVIVQLEHGFESMKLESTKSIG